MQGIATPTIGFKPTPNLISIESQPNPKRYRLKRYQGQQTYVKGIKVTRTSAPKYEGTITYNRCR